jgi:dihydroorotate dehydrogenase
MNLTKIFFSIYRRLIFLLPPEAAHIVSLSSAEIIYKSWLKDIFKTMPTQTKKNVMGINFQNVLGLAAGFDKNGDYLNFLSNIGFGYLEIGTVTPKPQFGNPKPRIFRITNETAIINHLGFNNKGINHMKAKLRDFDRTIPIGINIGKNSSTPIDKAYQDYEYCMKEIFYLADYITLNISSPNTENLRDLQLGKFFEDFLKNIKMLHNDLIKKYKKHVPLIIKISPDIALKDLNKLCLLLLEYEIDGVIATNTTVDKNVLKSKSFHNFKGGVSGKPIIDKSNKIIEQLSNLLNKKITIIGVGGIISSSAAKDKIKSGAELLQLYTGLVYSGTTLIKEICEEIK